MKTRIGLIGSIVLGAAMVTVGLSGDLALAVPDNGNFPGAYQWLWTEWGPATKVRICSRAIILDPPRCWVSWIWHLGLEKEVHEGLIPFHSRSASNKQGWSS